MEVIDVPKKDFWEAFADAQSHGLVHKVWQDITGISNTVAQNSAAAALQKDAQAFNSAESAVQREWESQEAQKNRDWQTEMANTAVQRQAADYQAAGFNPILAAGGAGASTGSAVGVNGAYGSSGIGSAQASNVNLLQSVGSAAVGLAALIKVIKAL